MTSSMQWHKDVESDTIPWNARYFYPSQANKAMKVMSRIPAKVSGYSPGQTIRVEIPAQGYINVEHTTLEFDVTLYGYGMAAAGTSGNTYIVRFQNNIQSIFSRVRAVYGSNVLEDIADYNVLIRGLTEWGYSNQFCSMDQASINQGIGGFVPGIDGGSSNAFQGNVNVRGRYIQGLSFSYNGTEAAISGGKNWGIVPNQYLPSGAPAPSANQAYCTRRYSVRLSLIGLMNQPKLLPAKYMASQLAIEITLEQAAGCIFANGVSGTTTANPTYYVSNVNLLPEVLLFDSTYDTEFVKGLQNGGIPIKCSSWRSYITSSSNSSIINFPIAERSRSIKSIFAVQRFAQQSFTQDGHASFFDTANGSSPSSLQSYQYRSGSIFYPASPVATSMGAGVPVSNGGAEAYSELAKALNTLGIAKPVSCNAQRWAVSPTSIGVLNAYDYTFGLGGFDLNGVPTLIQIEGSGNSFSGTLGSACYTSAISLETSNGEEISGLNGIQQNDISLIMIWSQPQVSGGGNTPTTIEAFVHFDYMLILKDNNIVELIE